MNIFKHELKAYLKSVLIWSVSMAAISVMFVFIFISLAGDISAFKEVLENLPEAVKKIFSIYADSLSTLEGFYSFVFMYVTLCGAIQAMNLGVSIVSKEIRDKTADFLMTKPVSRKTILTSKLMAAFVCLLITNIVYLVITLPVTFTVKSEFDMGILLLITATLLFVQLMFMALGIIVSVIVGKIKSVIAISLSTVFAFFIASMLGSIIGDEAVRYITPFKYFDLGYILENGRYEAEYIIIAAIFVVVSIIASYLVYLKKDVHAV